ncbi:MAG TPA: 30S ribosomal protein S5 [Candidatus Nanoarchaeia archaeon]|nr:30S ribosomal protein S5 [Candidatus Nanoarchaeia archaeon]
MVVSKPSFNLDNWKPKTDLGRKVKEGKITDLNIILDNGYTILEPEIVDALLPDLDTQLLEVGQSKGKFGGGKGSIWKQTQKITSEGARIKFAAFAVVGNKNGYVGIGFGSSKETVPAREKAIRNAKLNILKIKRGCGSWDCNCNTHHSIPFKITGKAGSVIVTFKPAPRGTGLKAERKNRTILDLAGIKDVYAKTLGKTSTKLNFFRATFEALKQLTKMKSQDDFDKQAGVVEGAVVRSKI